MRIDLLWLSYGTHVKMFSGFSRELLRSKGQFFGRVLAYYLFVFVATVALFLLRNKADFLALYYMAFLAGSITMTYFDYLFPSYVRYRRNVGAGRWGFACFRQLDFAHFDALNWPTLGDIDSCTAACAVRW